ncbi:PIN domain-like protein, partial [Lentinula edodes]
MGVAGLWPLLEPTQSVTTLIALSLTKFGATSRGFRIGIDASIWFFHTEYGKEGENPELRMLFFRCAQLLSQGFLPLFIFDGPLRPDIKRRKQINKSANKLVTGMQDMIEAFGFEYHTAPGEAEAELAFLNRIGLIDGILSDDVDNFLFGAHTVIRNRSSTHAGAKSTIEKAKVYTYTLPHPAFPDLNRENLIFIALCSGGDYGTGLDNCGIKISYGLARAGFGKQLCQAALNHDQNSDQLKNFLKHWKSELTQELRTNASGFLPQKSPKLASTIPDSFPEIDVLLAYMRPITSESLGCSKHYDDLLINDGWLKKDPSLPLLAEKCQFYFEWGILQSIIKRFRTVIFHGVTLRIMRRAHIREQTSDAKSIDLEVIRAHFAAGGYAVEDMDSPCPEFIKDISISRTHESTSKTLEYRVAINPTILVQLAAHGVKGIRQPEDKDKWSEFKEVENKSSDEGRTKKKEYLADPMLPLKLWLPAVLVREAVPGLVEAHEEVWKQKEKKAGK